VPGFMEHYAIVLPFRSIAVLQLTTQQHNRNTTFDILYGEIMTLLIKVKGIRGHCPVYKVGDSFLIKDGYKLVSKIPLCMHSLACIMPYYVALSRGAKPEELGLGKEEKAYVRCLEPGPKYTLGGTVVFEIESI